MSTTITPTDIVTQFGRGGEFRHVNDLAAALCNVARLLYDRGWALGTSGNYSAVLERDPLRLLITASGRDKRTLDDRDLLVVDERGAALEPGAPKPSAETLVHVMLARRPGVGAVLHTHSVWNTLVSEHFGDVGCVRIAGLEMLKGLAGVTTHETAVDVPIFANTQDIAALAAEAEPRLPRSAAPPHAFLIRGHGLYTWGETLAEARRHVEILEFLFEVVGRRALKQ